MSYGAVFCAEGSIPSLIPRCDLKSLFRSIFFSLELGLPHSSRTIRGMGTSFRRDDFWDRMSGQVLVISRSILFETTIKQS